MPNWIHFPSQNPSKSHQKPILEGIIFLIEFGIDFLYHLGSMLAPKKAPRWPRGAPRWPQEAPKTTQENPKSWDSPRLGPPPLPRRSPRRSKRLPRRPGSPPKAPKDDPSCPQNVTQVGPTTPSKHSISNTHHHPKNPKTPATLA